MWGRGRGGLCAGEQVRRLMGEYCGLDGLVFGSVGEVLAWRGRWAAVCIPGDCLGQVTACSRSRARPCSRQRRSCLLRPKRRWCSWE
eukprot:1179424-Rhodomonas_salina.1